MSDLPGGTGGPVPGSGPPLAPRPVPAQPKNGVGTAALVVGVVSLVLAVLVIFAPLGALLGVIGVILAIVGMARVSSGLATNRGHAVGGLVTALLGLLIGVTVTISVGGFLATHWNDLRTFATCLDDATTDEARDTCAQTFADVVD